MKMPFNLTPQVLNIGHRGARAYAPENTLAAIVKAKSFGCEMIELDVRLSKDGILVVFHDEDLLRCTDVRIKLPDRCHANLSEFCYQELTQLDAGSWFVEQLALPSAQRLDYLKTLTADELVEHIRAEDLRYYASGAIKIPTLKAAIELAMQHGMRVNIELKALENAAGFAQAVVDLVVELAAEQTVLISSFEHDYLKQVRQLNAALALAVLTCERIENVVDYLKHLGATAFHPCCYQTNPLNGKRYLYTDDFQIVRDAGLTVNVWTCNNQLDMREIFLSGVNGLVSDYPNRVRAVRGF